MIALDADERVAGVTSWLPVYRDQIVVGWTLDVMRRTAAGMPGVMGFLIASVAIRLREAGLQVISLSGAASQPAAGHVRLTPPTPDSTLAFLSRKSSPPTARLVLNARRSSALDTSRSISAIGILCRFPPSAARSPAPTCLMSPPARTSRSPGSSRQTADPSSTREEDEKDRRMPPWIEPDPRPRQHPHGRLHPRRRRAGRSHGASRSATRQGP